MYQSSKFFNFLWLLCVTTPFFQLCPWPPTNHLFSATSFQALLTCSFLCAPGPALARGKSVGCSHEKEGQAARCSYDSRMLTLSQSCSTLQPQALHLSSCLLSWQNSSPEQWLFLPDHTAHQSPPDLPGTWFCFLAVSIMMVSSVSQNGKHWFCRTCKHARFFQGN